MKQYTLFQTSTYNSSTVNLWKHKRIQWRRFLHHEGWVMRMNKQSRRSTFSHCRTPYKPEWHSQERYSFEKAKHWNEIKSLKMKHRKGLPSAITDRRCAANDERRRATNRNGKPP